MVQSIRFVVHKREIDTIFLCLYNLNILIAWESRLSYYKSIHGSD